MEDANLYNGSNGLQRRDAHDVLVEFQDGILKVRPGANVIDVGCGDGYVTSNLLRKYLPKDIGSITGVDICKEMIDFARKKYKDHLIGYNILNINEKMDECFGGKFDLITSFYCLHWASNQELVMKNFHDMLIENGTCVFIYPIRHAVFDSYKVLKAHPKWARYIDYNNITPYMEKFSDPAIKSEHLMRKAGFREINVEMRTKFYSYHSIKHFQDFFISVNPFVKNMTLNEVEEYKKDALNVFLELPSIEVAYNDEGMLKSITTIYSVLVASARK